MMKICEAKKNGEDLHKVVMKKRKKKVRKDARPNGGWLRSMCNCEWRSELNAVIGQYNCNFS